MSTRIHIVVTHALLEQIDRARGDVPRSAFVRRAVEQALVAKSMVSGEIPGQAFIESHETLPPAPAEQPRPASEVESEALRNFAEQSPPTYLPSRVRSSSEARDFRPVPKGKA